MFRYTVRLCIFWDRKSVLDGYIPGKCNQSLQRNKKSWTADQLLFRTVLSATIEKQGRVRAWIQENRYDQWPRPGESSVPSWIAQGLTVSVSKRERTLSALWKGSDGMKIASFHPHANGLFPVVRRWGLYYNWLSANRKQLSERPEIMFWKQPSICDKTPKID